MPVENISTGPRETSEYSSLMSQYETIYQQSQTQIDRLSKADVRNQLDAFLKNNNFKVSREQQEIMENEQLMRGLLAVAMAEGQLAHLRTQILQKVDDAVKAVPPKDQYRVLKEQFQKIAADKPGDMILFNELMYRLIGAEAVQVRENYQDASKKPLLDAGKNWISNGGERPSEFNQVPVPQLEVFEAFRMNVLYQESFKDLRIQLGREVNTPQEFVEKTFTAYLQFLDTHQISRTTFCPDKDFYQKLCTVSGISDEMFTAINTSNIETSANPQQFEASQARNESFFRERRKFHELQAERLKSQVVQLKDQSKQLRESGNITRANEIDLQVLQLEGQQKNHETKATEFSGMIDANAAVSQAYERELLASEGARHFSPNAEHLRNLPGIQGTIGSAFAGISRGMDWVGRQVPDTGNPMSWDVGGMLVGIGKTGLAAGGIINLIKGFAPTYMGFHKGVGALFKGKPIVAVQEMFGGIKETLNPRGEHLSSIATATGLFASVKFGTMENADRLVSWIMDAGTTVGRKIANNEITAPTLEWAKKDLFPWTGEKLQHFKTGIIDPSITKVKDVLSWGADKWNFLKDLGVDLAKENVLISVEEFKAYFESMKITQQEVAQQFHIQPHLKNLGLTVDTVGISSKSFAKLCQRYSEKNRTHDQSQGTLGVPLEDLAEAGFLFKNGTKMSKDQLRNTASYTSLPEAQRTVQISPSLSQNLVKQADFWLRNYPDESKTRESMTSAS